MEKHKKPELTPEQPNLLKYESTSYREFHIERIVADVFVV